MLQFRSTYCDVCPDTAAGVQLHVMHIQTPAVVKAEREPILMVHGMVENGRIFYHESGKGLACYLANQGFDVYVADFRGQGKSTPAISARSAHGQTETIRDDIPTLIQFVLQETKHTQLQVVAHSWGGVLMNAALLRDERSRERVTKAVYFGTKRTVRAQTLQRYFNIEFFWNRIAKVMAKVHGYVPAAMYGFGDDNETRQMHKDCVKWVQKKRWVDTKDKFDYGAAATVTTLPPIWYFAAINDSSLGHREDVKRFIKESGSGPNKYTLLSQAEGFALNYNHINMLTASEAVTDHFPLVKDWLLT